MPLKDYAKTEVESGQASGAPVKLSTYGATVAAGILALLTGFNGPFEEVFGTTASPWLKFATLAIIVIAWAAIMTADTLARRAPGTKPPADSATVSSAGEGLYTVEEVEDALRIVHSKHQREATIR